MKVVVPNSAAVRVALSGSCFCRCGRDAMERARAWAPNEGPL
jgi:hypothetical protein